MTPQSSHRGQQNIEALQSSQGMPNMYMTQPSQDTIGWSEETQADPPYMSQLPGDPSCLTQPQQPLQERLLPQAEAGNVSGPVPMGVAATGSSHPSRLLMKIKSKAAAAAINNAVPTLSPSPATSGRQADLSTLPSVPIVAPAQESQAAHPQHSPAMLEAAATAASVAAAEAAAAGATAAATDAAEQAKQAVAAAVAAQEECRGMAAAAIDAATADKENQQAGHTKVLDQMTGVMQSCTDLSTSMAALQGISNAQATKLSTVESTCQALIGLMHGLASQTEQALAAFKTPQVPQPAVRVLRCVENFTQTSPVSVTHQGIQAELAGITRDACTGPCQVAQHHLALLYCLCLHVVRRTVAAGIFSQTSRKTTN